jgi:protein involved in polysaccharide export with SLBB domain
MRISGILITAMAAVLSLRASADLGALDPLAKPSSRLGPGWVLALSVSVRGTDEEELCGQFPLNEEGRLALTIGGEPIAKIALKGLTVAEARARILEAIRKYYAVEPEVLAGIAKIPRMHVLMEGATFRNGWLTLPEGARLSDALAECNYMPSADLHRVQIFRIEKDGTRSKLTADIGKLFESGTGDRFSDPVLQNNDRVSLPLSSVPVIPPTIAVLGEVKSPGVYPWQPAMRVRDALMSAQGMLPTADAERVTVRRMRDNTYMTVDGARAMQNVPTENIELKPDDTLFIPTRDSGLRYSVLGAVPAPATFDYKKPVTLMQAIKDAGGLKPDADHKILLIRNMLHDPARAEAVTLDVDRIVRGEQPDVRLEPGDVVQVPQKKKASSPLLDIGLLLLRIFVF